MALHADGLLDDADLQRINEHFDLMASRWTEQIRQGLQPPGDSGLPPSSRCRQCDRAANSAQNFCATCGAATGVSADGLRYADFLINSLSRSAVIDITPEHAKRCVAHLSTSIRDAEADLKGQAATHADRGTATAPNGGRRNLIEILLDPQSIRWLLVSGGVLLAVGLVIFLSSLGVFENANVVASAMGVGTLAVLVSGIVTIRYTRHHLAGRAAALLGCLVMPLNLWFYHANALVTLDGHLWLAALICCVLYAAAAYLLRDPIFVYVLFAGITMTGMLMLADLHRLVEISAPAALLISLGLISLHAERAFADDDGPFSRKRFGSACFRSAQALIGLGLLLLMGAQVAALVPDIGLGLHQVAALRNSQWLTLALVLAGGYGYAYASFVAPRNKLNGQAAVICLLWAEMLGLRLGHLTHHFPVLISAMALTALAMDAVGSLLSRNSIDDPRHIGGILKPVGIALLGTAVALGMFPHLRAGLPNTAGSFDLSVTWGYVGAMALAALCSRFAAALNARGRERLSMAYHVTTAGATLIGIVGLLELFGLPLWPTGATGMMTLPIIYLIAANFYRDGPAKRALPAIASVMAVALTAACLVATHAQWISPSAGRAADLWLAAFMLEGAAFFALAAATRRGQYNVYLAAALVCGMVYPIINFWAFPVQSYNVAIAFAGLVGLILHRIANAGTRESESRIQSLFNCGNAMLSLPMTGVMLLTLSRLAAGHMRLSMLWTPASLGLLAMMAAVVTVRGARRWYLALAISQIALCLLTLAHYSTLGLLRKLELFSVLTGLMIMVGGYVLWYRTQDGKSDGVGLSLFIGALLAGLPPAVFAMVNRFGYEVSISDELSLVTISVLMFLTGMMTRVRATTLVGGGLLIAHLLTLIVFAGMKAQFALGVYVSVGGAALFAVGVVLSVNRERLLSVPERVKQRQGIFRVLAWT